MSKWSITSTRCFIDGSIIPATINIVGNVIEQIQKDIHGNEAIDFGDALIMPGVIDAHVHINEPGRTEWEGFESATLAAAAGGSTTLIEMPLNSDPVVINKFALEKKLLATQNKLNVNCGFYGGFVGNNLEQIPSLIDAGVFGIKSFLIDSGIADFHYADEIALSDLYAKPLEENVPFLFHCEKEDDTADHKLLVKNPYSFAAFVASRPDSWEINAIRLLLDLMDDNPKRTHIVHLSSSDALPILRDHKAKFSSLSVETCPHYLIFNSESIPDGDTRYKCTPPIRSKANQKELIKAVVTGDIDFICSDHSPCVPERKEFGSGNLLKAWGGIAGLQFLLSASWTALKDHMAIEKFIPLVTESPARFLGIDNRKGKLEKGYDADIVVWEPEKSFVVDERNVFHRHKETPYEGMEMAGRVAQTIVNGKVVYDGQKFINKNAGKVVYRNAR